MEIPVTVKEGESTFILIDKNLIVNYSVPGANARIISADENQITLGLSGTGKQLFILNSDKTLKLNDSGKGSVVLNDTSLTLNFGVTWEEQIVQVRFVN
jgi:hypothetical protein